MAIKAKPFGYHKKFDWGADIHSVSYTGQLVVRVLKNRNDEGGIEVRFSRNGGFPILDEIPLAEYWTDKDFPSGYPVLEVFDGVWPKEEGVRLGYKQRQREWIVVTAGACVSVFSELSLKLSRKMAWPH